MSLELLIAILWSLGRYRNFLILTTGYHFALLKEISTTKMPNHSLSFKQRTDKTGPSMRISDIILSSDYATDVWLVKKQKTNISRTFIGLFLAFLVHFLFSRLLIFICLFGFNTIGTKK